MIDLYSDTVSAPTKRMCDAMVSSPLGDAITGDCPTVLRLEEMAAEMLGKEAAALPTTTTTRTIQKTTATPETMASCRIICTSLDKSACISGSSRFSIFVFIVESSAGGIVSAKPEWNMASVARAIFEITKPPQIPIPTVPPIVRANWCDVVATPRSEISMLF